MAIEYSPANPLLETVGAYMIVGAEVCCLCQLPDWQDQLAGHAVMHQLDGDTVVTPVTPTASDIAVNAVHEPEGIMAFFPAAHPESTLPQVDPPNAVIRVYMAPLALTMACAVTTPHSAGDECATTQEIVLPASGASNAESPVPVLRFQLPDWQDHP